jgi:hypothetical protein
MWAELLRLVIRGRLFFWRHGWRLPALPGWEERLHAVALSPDTYQDPRGGFGAPLEWSLAQVVDGRIVLCEAVCLWSGTAITGSSQDMTLWGVRCARCGAALLAKHAGMRIVTDVPSCPACRSTVEGKSNGR